MLGSGFFSLRIRFEALYAKLGKDMSLPKIKMSMKKWSTMHESFKSCRMI
jgi:hypothetical protein